MNNNINTIYNLCNRNNWFTCGTNSQYSKVFDLAKAGMPKEMIARCIWLCSNTDNDVITYNSIYDAITESDYVHNN